MRTLTKVLVAGVAVLLAAGAGRVAYGRWWWGQAEEAIQSTVQSVVANQEPSGLNRVVKGDSLHDPLRDFPLPYSVEGADNALGGTSFVDILMPGVYVAQLRFANDAVYEVEARRLGAFGPWQVRIGPAETR